MSRPTVTQIAVIAGAVLLFVLLIFADTTLPKKPEAENGRPVMARADFDAPKAISDARITLSVDQRKREQDLMNELGTADNTSRPALLDSVSRFWEELQKPHVAAVFAKQEAELSSNADNWKKAGDRFYLGLRFVNEKERPGLCRQAIECYTKSLDLNPADVEVKINLASCYVDGTADPMKGITLLKEVEKTDSDNVNLQMSFAFFSVKSQQFDKAIYRFNKVLKLNPEFIEAYLHLADVYQAKGDKQKAVECLQKYISLEKDATIKTEVQNYINKLQNT